MVSGRSKRYAVKWFLNGRSLSGRVCHYHGIKNYIELVLKWPPAIYSIPFWTTRNHLNTMFIAYCFWTARNHSNYHFLNIVNVVLVGGMASIVEIGY